MKKWIHEITKRRPKHIVDALYQIYGELNRIRLILGEDSERGKDIEEWDKWYNEYAPFTKEDQGDTK